MRTEKLEQADGQINSPSFRTIGSSFPSPAAYSTNIPAAILPIVRPDDPERSCMASPTLFRGHMTCASYISTNPNKRSLAAICLSYNTLLSLQDFALSAICATYYPIFTSISLGWLGLGRLRPYRTRMNKEQWTCRDSNPTGEGWTDAGRDTAHGAGTQQSRQLLADI
ncbi:uncharacterized protein BDR25DRAFT_359460 [Lindgomyces ingoldianus]|uniref:Uncharacterized protein n=1 Tax=Lindgomyces ingoldianus TaxID=673940 RepID=A0ACB6QHW6_9PLEO|nr:uncharacterized protein BDR25DRAFT_359460 [Lindgomyces ingoldianus]KAF2466563.1 hypothetical protein BDR25DRAFT_359460 [Lindgomyces ingoldianus]